jgi:hypothetical protein
MTKPTKRKSRARRTDAQLREFERRDLGDDIAASGAGAMIRRSRTTSIALDDRLIAKLRAKGAKRGIGYQTMLKLIVAEHVDDY